MQTIPVLEGVNEAATDLPVELMHELVTTSFEACAEFVAGGDCSPVCGVCGWLEAEHGPEAAEVRALPRRSRPNADRAPRRLAS